MSRRDASDRRRRVGAGWRPACSRRCGAAPPPVARLSRRTPRAQPACADVRAVQRLRGVPQQPRHPERRGRLDRRQLARHHDGQLRPRPVRAGQRSARDDRPRVACRGHRGRVRHLPPAGGAEDRARGRRQGRSLRALRERAGRAREAASTTLAQDGVSRAPSAIRLPPTASARGTASTATSSSLAPRPDGLRRAFGPFGRRRRAAPHHALGHAASSRPRRRTSASRQLCATCHTLITEALGPDGRVIGSLPEQMNYQEWRHSAFFQEGRSCQSCHMPRAPGPVRVASVLGDDRDRPVPPHVRRRQRFHAAADESLPGRARRRGDIRGARGHAARDDPATRTGHRDGRRSIRPPFADGMLAVRRRASGI